MRYLTWHLFRSALALSVIAGVSGCSRAGADRVAPPDSTIDAPSAETRAPSGETEPSSDTLVTGRPCEEVEGATEEMAEQAKATIPVVVGLTFGFVWVGPDSGKTNFDHECLTQVTAVEAGRIVYKSSCSNAPDPGQHRTQLCRADLRDGTIYRTETGVQIPDLVAGSTMSVLSRRSFRELKARGETQFRQVHLLASTWQTGAEAPEPDATVYVREDIRGPLRHTGTATIPVQVNDSLMSLPVITATAVLRDPDGKFAGHEKRFAILDDERFPIVLDNQRITNASSIKFSRITWPRASAIEQDLATERTSTVYGIYFDYNSAEIRTESEVVLQEIARALDAHADWALSIVGHTDSIGGAGFNQTLSEQRAEAVRMALVERYRIAASRLTSSGSGASRPVDRNDTPEGRSRNRRVELTRP